MARILANHIVLHGNKDIKNLEQQIYDRLYSDSKKKYGSRTAVQRILFGLDENSEFDCEEKIGTFWTYFQARAKNQIIFISPFPSVSKLQEHITFYAAKIDPKVVVQLEYDDDPGAVIGTRLTTYTEAKGILTFKSHKFTPSADDQELSRPSMKKIQNWQRKVVLNQLVAEMGKEYKKINLNILPNYSYE